MNETKPLSEVTLEKIKEFCAKYDECTSCPFFVLLKECYFKCASPQFWSTKQIEDEIN